jgi:DNA-binding NarL/FixJ family response regulator
LSKTARAHELRDAIRAVAAGESIVQPFDPGTVKAAAHRLEPEDLPVLGMLLDGTAYADIALVMGLDHRVLMHRLDRIIARLAPHAD